MAKLTSELRPHRESSRLCTCPYLDRVGHAHPLGNEYLAAVQRTDQLLGRIINTVADRPELRTLSLSLPRITGE